MVDSLVVSEVNSQNGVCIDEASPKCNRLGA